MALIITSMVAAVAVVAAASIIGEQGRSIVMLNGIVSDSMCGSTHVTKKDGEAECTRDCVKWGADYALMVGKKMYILKGHPAELDKFAGGEVVVKGEMVRRNTIVVEWVTPTSENAGTAPDKVISVTYISNSRDRLPALLGPNYAWN